MRAGFPAPGRRVGLAPRQLAASCASTSGACHLRRRCQPFGWIGAATSPENAVRREEVDRTGQPAAASTLLRRHGYIYTYLRHQQILAPKFVGGRSSGSAAKPRIASWTGRVATSSACLDVLPGTARRTVALARTLRIMTGRRYISKSRRPGIINVVSVGTGPVTRLTSLRAARRRPRLAGTSLLSAERALRAGKPARQSRRTFSTLQAPPLVA